MNSNSHSIEICFASTGNYAPFVATTALSIIENTTEHINFHVLTENFKENDKNILIKFIQDKNHSIDFIDISNELKVFQGMELSCWKSYIICARILIPQLFFNTSKAIYLDSDIIVDCDIKELWDVDLKEFTIAAAQDYLTVKDTNIIDLHLSPEHIYFNSGVLLFDCNKFREKSVTQKIFKLLQSNTHLKYPDQDILNICFDNNNYMPLDKTYNSLVFYNIYNQQNTPKIIHYVMAKPWVTKDCFYSEIFWHYAEQTPYYEQIKRMFRINRLIFK
ncbi:hypothetical protein FACS1894182_07400 [Bacteroidia bacterium]|nr:hypothetical protein FACS1894182_07400 [Bacteroidia bacterium]